MTCDPNRYKLAFPTIQRAWERGMVNPDFEQIVTEIAVNTGIELLSVCYIIEKLYNDDRMIPLQHKFIEQYKYDVIIPLEL